LIADIEIYTGETNIYIEEQVFTPTYLNGVLIIGFMK